MTSTILGKSALERTRRCSNEQDTPPCRAQQTQRRNENPPSRDLNDAGATRPVRLGLDARCADTQSSEWPALHEMRKTQQAPHKRPRDISIMKPERRLLARPANHLAATR
jgi:hypothetical protein